MEGGTQVRPDLQSSMLTESAMFFDAISAVRITPVSMSTAFSALFYYKKVRAAVLPHPDARIGVRSLDSHLLFDAVFLPSFFRCLSN